MAAKFADLSVRDGLERSLRNAKHLRAKDSAAVAAARALADKIDAWDVIVEWALEDAAGSGRPKVPANDNVSLASFLKYCEALRILPGEVKESAPVVKSESPVERMKRERAARQKKVG